MDEILFTPSETPGPESQAPVLVLTDTEVFTRIWTKPREVFRFIMQYKYEKYQYLILALLGISRAFDRASMRNMGDKQSIEFIVIACIIGGALLGWLSYYFYAWLVQWTGKWLKANGNDNDIMSALIYGSIPSIVALLCIFIQIAVYGNEIFKKDGDIFSAGLLGNIIYYGSVVAELVLSCWTVVLVVIGISEAQQLSIGKAILNLLLPIFIIGIPLLAIALSLSYL